MGMTDDREAAFVGGKVKRGPDWAAIARRQRRRSAVSGGPCSPDPDGSEAQLGLFSDPEPAPPPAWASSSAGVQDSNSAEKPDFSTKISTV